MALALLRRIRAYNAPQCSDPRDSDAGGQAMKRLALSIVLALGVVGALSAQPSSGPSISGLADTIHVDHVNGRTVFTGDVVIAIDGTEISTKDVAVYDPITNSIELAN